MLMFRKADTSASAALVKTGIIGFSASLVILKSLVPKVAQMHILRDGFDLRLEPIAFDVCARWLWT